MVVASKPQSNVRPRVFEAAGVLILVSPAGTIAGLPEQPQRVLGVRRPISGRFGLPGGKLVSPETTREACIREFREETGFDAPLRLNIRLVTSRHFGKRRVDYFAAEIDAETASAITVETYRDPDVAWFTPQDYLAQSIFPIDDGFVFEKIFSTYYPILG